MVLSRKRLTAVLFELAFVVTRDNAFLDKLQAVALVAEAIQVYAYVFSVKLQWGAPDFQAGLELTLLHVDRNVIAGFYWAVAAGVSALLLSAAIVWREMLAKGAVSSMGTLRFLRAAVSVFATFMLFPAVSLLLQPIADRVGAGGYSMGVGADHFVGLSAALLPLFLLVIGSLFPFFFEADLLTTRWIARADASHDLEHIATKTAVAAAFTFAASPAPGAWVLFVHCALAAWGDIVHPAYFADLMNLTKAFMSTAHLFAAAGALYVVYFPQSDTNLMRIVFGVSLAFGALGAAALAARFLALDAALYTRKLRSRHFAAAPFGGRRGWCGCGGSAAVAHDARAPDTSRSGSHSFIYRDEFAAAAGAGADADAGAAQLFAPSFMRRIITTGDADIAMRRALRNGWPFQLGSPLAKWFTLAALRSPNLELADVGDAAAADGAPARVTQRERNGQLAAALLEASLAFFPRSPVLLTRLAAVLTLAFKSADRAGANRALATSLRYRPHMQQRYIAFFLRKFLQRSAFVLETGVELDVLDVMRYSHDLKRIRTYQAAAQRSAVRFWRAVLSVRESGDSSSALYTLSGAARAAVRYEELTISYYTRLLESFPSARTALRLFAGYVSTIANEPTAAAAIVEHVDALDEDEQRRHIEKVRVRWGRLSAVSATGLLKATTGAAAAAAAAGGGAQATPAAEAPPPAQAREPRIGATHAASDKAPGAPPRGESKGAGALRVLAPYRSTRVVPAAAAAVVAAPPPAEAASLADPASPKATREGGSSTDNSGAERGTVVSVPQAPAGGATGNALPAGGLTIALPRESQPADAAARAGASARGALSSARAVPANEHGSSDEADAGGATSDGGGVESPVGTSARGAAALARPPLGRIDGAAAAAAKRRAVARTSSVGSRQAPADVDGVSVGAGGRPRSQSRVSRGRRGSRGGRSDMGGGGAAAGGADATPGGATPGQAAGAPPARRGSDAQSVGHSSMHSAAESDVAGDDVKEAGNAGVVARVVELLRLKAAVRDNHVVTKQTALFSRSMAVTLCTLIACIISIYVIGVALLTAHARDAGLVADAGGMRRASQDIAYQTRRLELFASGFSSFSAASVVSVQASLLSAATTLNNASLALYNQLYTLQSSLDPIDPTRNVYVSLLNRWNDEKWDVMRVDENSRATIVEPMSAWSLYQRYLTAARALVAAPNTTFARGQSAALLATANMRLILDNGYANVFQATRDLVNAYQDSYRTETRKRDNELVAITCVVVIVPLLLTLFAFVPSFRRLRRERRLAYHLFAAVPDDALAAVLRRYGVMSVGGGKAGLGGAAAGAALPASTAAKWATLPQITQIGSGASDAGGSASGGATLAAARPQASPPPATAELIGLVSASAAEAAMPSLAPAVDAAAAAPRRASAKRAGARGSGGTVDVHKTADGAASPVAEPPSPVAADVETGSADDIGEDAEAEAAAAANDEAARDADAGHAAAAAGAASGVDANVSEASSAVAESKENETLKRVVLPYLCSIMLLLAISLALLSVLLQTNARFGGRAIEINAAGSRRSGSHRLLGLATELIRNDTGTIRTLWGSEAALRERLIFENDAVLFNHREVLYGSASVGGSLELPGILGRSATMDALTLAAQPNGDASLDSQFLAYHDAVDTIVRAPLANLSLALPAYVFVRTAQGGTATFSQLLNAAKDWLVGSANPVLQSSRAVLDVLFGVSWALAAIAALLMRAAVLEVRRSIAVNRAMLLQLPASALRATPSLKAYLEDGAFDATLLLREDEAIAAAARARKSAPAAGSAPAARSFWARAPWARGGK